MDRQELIDAGYIRVQEHPDDARWKIYNYTHKTVYERLWNKHTLMCRGLIEVDGEIVARGMPKFFNHTEPEAPYIDLDEYVEAFDKMDGSLGIMYPAPDGKMAIATRGSFTSPQARWATEKFRKTSSGEVEATGYTSLYEIIYPKNRVVVDYGDREELTYLGAVDNKTGVFSPPALQLADWFVERIYEGPYRGALALPPRENREGLVVITPDSRMVKIKQDDYIALHKVVTNITPKNSWERYKELGAQYLDGIPDEFHGEVAAHVNAVLDRVALLEALTFLQVEKIPDGLSRKQFAEYAKRFQFPGLLFALYDNDSEKFDRQLERICAP